MCERGGGGGGGKGWWWSCVCRWVGVGVGKYIFTGIHDGLASLNCKPCFLILSLCISYVTQLINSGSKETNPSFLLPIRIVQNFIS